MKLSALAKEINRPARNHSILIYGPPKTGKTSLVGTAAAIPEINRIVWIDLENGAETLLHMGLSPSDLDKIELIRIPDTREIPRGIETVLKLFSSKTPVTVCDLHGKVGCVECKNTGTTFHLASMTHNDLLVIDSGSQLGDSALALACLGKPIDFKPSFDEYGIAGKYLSDICGVIQACQNTNFVMISHELVVEEEVNGIKRDKIYPLVGTRQFCSKVSKYFGTVVYTELKMGKHAAGSSSTYKPNHVTGSRVNAKMEASKDGPNMRSILIEGGILRPKITL